MPHLGAQARILLDRIVASGTVGVNGRDAVDWVLSRLIELSYVEESTLHDMTFVCTPAGYHRWQIEAAAGEERSASALRRQLIRRRLDERFTRLGIDTSTALTIAYPPVEPRLHRGVPAQSNPPLRAEMRLSSALASVFAAAAAALVVISASGQPQEVRELLFPPTSHAAAVPADQPENQTVPVDAPVAAAVAAPVDVHTEEAPGHGVGLADAAPADTQRAGPIDTIAPSLGNEQNVDLPQAEKAARDAASRNGEAILNSAVTAVALIDAAVSESGHIAIDFTIGLEQGLRSTAVALSDSAVGESGRFATYLTASVERSFKPISAILLYTLVDIGRAISAWTAVTQQVRDDAPALLAQAAVVHATPDERVTAKSPTVHGSTANVDPQHMAVERLNTLSLAAARRGEAWRPNSLANVAVTGLPARAR